MSKFVEEVMEGGRIQEVNFMFPSGEHLRLPPTNTFFGRCSRHARHRGCRRSVLGVFWGIEATEGVLFIITTAQQTKHLKPFRQ